MEVVLKSRSKRMLKKVEQDHYWYDSHTKQMLHGHGGKMVFKYDPQQRRNVPCVEDQKEWVYGNDYDRIDDWVKENQGQFGINIVQKNSRYDITIDVSPSVITALTEELYRQSIIYDYDEKEVFASTGSTSLVKATNVLEKAKLSVNTASATKAKIDKTKNRISR